MRRIAVPVLALSLVLAACGGAALDPSTGVRGVVRLGPTCPVQRLGSPCPDRPIAAVVTATDGSGVVRGTARSDGQGRYVLVLGPGRYVLTARPAHGFGEPAPVPVTVVGGRLTDVDLTVDSGIR
jgi:hypothetical protein